MTTNITKSTERKEEESAQRDSWPVIHSYSRSNALADGVLVAVDVDLARNAGFRAPVALTQAVYNTCVLVPPGVNCQDETGRMFDVLWMTTLAYRETGLCQSRVNVQLYVRNDNKAARLIRLMADIGPGDDGNSVVTIGYPDEM
jgi:hypothetical protein